MLPSFVVFQHPSTRYCRRHRASQGSISFSLIYECILMPLPPIFHFLYRQALRRVVHTLIITQQLAVAYPTPTISTLFSTYSGDTIQVCLAYHSSVDATVITVPWTQSTQAAPTDDCCRPISGFTLQQLTWLFPDNARIQ